MAKVIDPLESRAGRAWGALDIAKVEGATVRLHRTDGPYRRHRNDGAEVFVVVDGEVDMHYREGGEERVARLKAGRVFCAAEGDEHFASPAGEARVLVVEREGSV